MATTPAAAQSPDDVVAFEVPGLSSARNLRQLGVSLDIIRRTLIRTIGLSEVDADLVVELVLRDG